VPTAPPSDLLSEARLLSHQVADLLRVHVNTVNRWATLGARGVKLRSHVLGGRRYFLRDDVERFIEECQEAPFHAS
jgi:hypothetical protein